MKESDQGPSEISLAALENHKKKQKRKNKKKPKPTINSRSSEDNLEDEVEKSVREVNRLLGEADPGNKIGEDSEMKSHPDRSLLAVEPKHLNPENEMKRIFGSKVVMGEQQSREHRRQNRGQRHRAHRASHWLVVPKPSWPQPGKTGLAMKFLESDKNSYQYFTFEHSPSYQVVQKRFFYAVDSLNPEFIIVRTTVQCSSYKQSFSKHCKSPFLKKEKKHCLDLVHCNNLIIISQKKCVIS